MDLSSFKKFKIPDAPGVYFFLGDQKEILYIGKATSLRNRIRSYFDGAIRDKRSVLIEKMVSEAKSISYTVTDSVLEAMILEVNLIRTHKPEYNSRSKDDKSYNNLVITNEEFPRVLIIRNKDLPSSLNNEYKYIFGPFPNGTLFKEAFKIIRKLFQFYDGEVSTAHLKSKVLKGKIDFNTQIGLYPSNVSKKEYAQTIKHIRLFFEGKKHKVIIELERTMMNLAKNEKFEEAQVIKKRVFALKHIQDVSLIKNEFRTYKDDKNIRIEAYDIAHMGGSDMVGVMTVVIGSEPVTSEYKKFIIKTCDGSNDPKALSEVLTRRLKHTEWKYPDLIVVDGSTAQKNAAQNI